MKRLSIRVLRFPILAFVLTVLLALASCGGDGDKEDVQSARIKNATERWLTAKCKITYSCNLTPDSRTEEGTPLHNSLEECLQVYQGVLRSELFDNMPESCFSPYLDAYEACVARIEAEAPESLCKDVGKEVDLPGESGESAQKFPECKAAYNQAPSAIGGREECGAATFAFAVPSRQRSTRGAE